MRAVFLAFDETRRFFKPERSILSGNPIRRALRDRLLAASSTTGGGGDTLRVFCFGGSLGAKAVNAIMVDAAAVLARQQLPIAVVHQTGADDQAATEAGYRAAGISAEVRDFIDDMAAEYARADLVVARAGATTVAELAAVGRPAILIPYPFAADHHQERNAAALAAAGAALVYQQSELDGAKLAAAIGELARDRPRLDHMRDAMRALGRPDAAGEIVTWLEAQA